ncbi:MAG: preprotein translocase subunit SecA [Candidatus Nealsonbacteria bacterium]
MSILTKFFGDANQGYLKKLRPQVAKINVLEKTFEGFSDTQLKEKTTELKEKFRGEQFSADNILPEAFALVREAAKRTLNQRHFDVQLIGGMVLHEGKIAEMKTGEGKTLSATLPVYLNALTGKGVHVVTVNDYLAKRDAVWMGQIYDLLGLSCGCIMHDTAFVYDPAANKDKERDTVGSFKVVEDYLRPVSRKEAYGADITYGTNNEFGFDYLKDNMVQDLQQQVQRGHHFAIVDEVDSILIDEARTPLIISAPDQESSQWYQEFARIIPKLDSKTDYEIDEKMKAVTLTEGGVNKVEKILGMGNIYEEKGIKYVHHLEQALRAEVLFKKDKDYVVKDGQIMIVDEFTGRMMPGRRWSGGLHQAIEAKEGVRVQPESLTLASVTFQNYFRMYEKIAGMTGTASTSAEEFDKVYKLDVVMIPTNKPMQRRELPDGVYKTHDGKLNALVREIKERHKIGQPVLVGTTSIEKNEYLGKLLEREGVPHQILNAKHHEQEGEIIAQAGKLGAVTIATNMAGRGVDIILGGNPQVASEADKVREVGGLHIIGTERHEARRIDNQLRGRAGRQGDPGSSQFFLSLEDDIMRIFGGARIKSLMGLLKIPEDQPIENKMISGAIESAQSKIEGMNFDLRKHILEYDDVMNKHRDVLYKKRKEMLTISDWQSTINDWLKTPEEKKAFEEKIKELGDNFNQVAKTVALRTLDMFWMNHLEEMEILRDSVRLRAYGQRDPLVEYKSEGHRMFQRLLDTIESNIAQTMLKVSLKPQPNFSPVENRPQRDSQQKKETSRNDPCPCGAKHPDGRPIKYKHCHGKNG